MQSYRVDGSKKFRLKNFNCEETGEFKSRHECIKEFTENLAEINNLQQRLYAEAKEGIIFVFQAMDAAGKDGAIRAVLSCLSPQGVSETSFKAPTSEELAHDYLWRFWKALPKKGDIAIFNRSYYEDVLVARVHKLYEKQVYADRIDKETILDNRYKQIRNFESYLYENNIRVVKIFLNVSKEEQARRFISRIDTPKKNWKISEGDIKERKYWDDYQEAFETCINKTAREHSPWYVVPADHKWYARLIISRIVLESLREINPQWPVLPKNEMDKLEEYRELLVNEEGVNYVREKRVYPADTAIQLALEADAEAKRRKDKKKKDKEKKKNLDDKKSKALKVKRKSSVKGMSAGKKKVAIPKK